MNRNTFILATGLLWTVLAAGCPRSGDGASESQTVAALPERWPAGAEHVQNGPADGSTEDEPQELQPDATATPPESEIRESLAQQRRLVEEELELLAASVDPDEERLHALQQLLRELDDRIASTAEVTEDLPPAEDSPFRLRGRPYSGPVRPIAELRDSLSEIWAVQFDTTFGSFTIEVYPELAPIHASKFLELVDAGFYNNMHAHRIAPGLAVQWGDLHDYGEAANLRPGQEPPLYPRYQERAELAVELPAEPARCASQQWAVRFAEQSSQTASPQPVINLAKEHELADQGAPNPPFASVVSGRDNIEMLATSFEPAMASAQAELRAALEAQGAPEAVIEQRAQDPTEWGRFIDKYWNPFRVALILEARITARPILD